MYTVNETDGVLEVCVAITNPPIQEDLPFLINLIHTSMAGTAGECNMCLHVYQSVAPKPSKKYL